MLDFGLGLERRPSLIESDKSPRELAACALLSPDAVSADGASFERRVLALFQSWKKRSKTGAERMSCV